jgi:hypothetical protein
MSAWNAPWKEHDMNTVTTQDGARIYYNLMNEDLLGLLNT